MFVEKIEYWYIESVLSYKEHKGAIDWNKLPPDLISEPKLCKFKTGLKVWVTENVKRFLP